MAPLRSAVPWPLARGVSHRWACLLPLAVAAVLLAAPAQAQSSDPANDAAQPATQPAAPNTPRPTDGAFFLTVHIAGGTGAVAVGGGYWLARRRLEPELLLGIVPKKLGGKTLGVVTLKTTYTPYAPQLGASRWQANPLSFGGLASYTFGPGLNSSRATKYPKGYYWWSSALRFGAVLGARLTHEGGAGWPQRSSYYAELGTNDLYLVSKITNRSLRLSEILTLGLGVKGGGK
ncbi:hypothetical protein F0P96_10175 [Hymenobacter busanensis]|uniref:Uncharacterized protein n=1 Tax=Hymenobacter busanensis TaxID=2607656 RepID=A0A7L4ZYG9_9BACT|nr:hypothetical protein [Hymenobacter busanensis]KAA9333328.1 hypothetical protein F0P96_10175 [Hymenobacter busanensis]QHJ07993.1 hypothetical protein GUY19_12135 [Hymenobacter busanensis]